MTSASLFTTVINRPPPQQFTRIPGRYVFAWYMMYEYVYSVYDPPLGDATSIAGFKHDIQDAQSSGIDGFALFVINRIDQYPSVYNMFAAAQELYQENPTQ